MITTMNDADQRTMAALFRCIGMKTTGEAIEATVNFLHVLIKVGVDQGADPHAIIDDIANTLHNAFRD